MTKEIKLTRGLVSLVDDDFYGYLSQWRWYAHLDRKNNKFYAYRTIKTDKGYSTTSMHQEVLLYPKSKIDHINGNTLDNRKENLRMCTSSQNGYNTKTRINNKSGYKGVSWDKVTNKWRAQIRVSGKVIHLGFLALKKMQLENMTNRLCYIMENLLLLIFLEENK